MAITNPTQTYDLCGDCTCRVVRVYGSWQHMNSNEHSDTDPSSCNCRHPVSSSEGLRAKQATEVCLGDEPKELVRLTDMVFDELSKMPEMKNISTKTLEEASEKVAKKIFVDRGMDNVAKNEYLKQTPVPTHNQTYTIPIMNGSHSHNANVITATAPIHTPSIKIGAVQNLGGSPGGVYPAMIEFEGHGKIVADSGHLKWIESSGQEHLIA